MEFRWIIINCYIFIAGLAGIPSTDVPTSDTITPVTTTVKTVWFYLII